MIIYVFVGKAKDWNPEKWKKIEPIPDDDKSVE